MAFAIKEAKGEKNFNGIKIFSKMKIIQMDYTLALLKAFWNHL